MTIRKINPFLVAYVMALIVLAGLGYMLSDYTIRSQEQHAALANKKFVTDVGFVALPQMDMSMASTNGQRGQLRMNISLEIEQKNMARMEDFQSRVTDRLVSYVRKMDIDAIRKPNALPMLRKELLKEVNSSSYPVPVLDIVFRQFIIM